MLENRWTRPSSNINDVWQLVTSFSITRGHHFGVHNLENINLMETIQQNLTLRCRIELAVLLQNLSEGRSIVLTQ